MKQTRNYILLVVLSVLNAHAGDDVLAISNDQLMLQGSVGKELTYVMNEVDVRAALFAANSSGLSLRKDGEEDRVWVSMNSVERRRDRFFLKGAVARLIFDYNAESKNRTQHFDCTQRIVPSPFPGFPGNDESSCRIKE